MNVRTRSAPAEPVETTSTIRPTWSVYRVAAWATVAAAVLALLGLLVTRSPLVGGDNSGCIAQGGGNNNCPRVEVPPEKLYEDEVLGEAKQYVDTPPPGNGPWPFIVTRDANIGLKVRTTNGIDAVHLGGLGHLQTAWVVCKAHSGFDPIGGGGDLWYKLKWRNQTQSMKFFQSDPGAPTTGWAYSFYLTPYRHNGNVPDCQ